MGAWLRGVRRFLRRSQDERARWEQEVVRRFVQSDAGAAYGLTRADRADFVQQFTRITENIPSGTPPVVHAALAHYLLSVPPETEGAVMECGVWKGASAASLSLVCKRMKRTLYVCDSFQGLPEDDEQRHVGLHSGVYGHYKKGMFAGSRDEVRDNMRQYGALDVCEFVEGFFAESLKSLSTPMVFAFLDVDLAQSTRDCLRYIWPLLADGGYVFSDDAGDLDVVRVFFDEPWWRETLGCSAPGFVGSGCGLPLNPMYSSLGYARKLGQFDPAEWRKAPFLHYPNDG